MTVRGVWANAGRILPTLIVLTATLFEIPGGVSAQPADAKSGVAPIAPYAGPSRVAPATAPAVVVLPPALPGDSSPATLRAAESVCDRLAAEVGADGTVQVVNRSELERILEERKAAVKTLPPVTGYSALIRLEVSGDGPRQKSVLNIIDLSSGNILGRLEGAWPLKEADIPSMKKTAIEAIVKAGVGSKGKVRIRLVGLIDVGKSPRLLPLAHHVSQMYGEALAKSPRVVLMQHLEARTTKEESLLILMGLSKLPGGARFVPQADATLEIRVLEREIVGKTFAETIIALGVRYKDGEKSDDTWVETRGTVKETEKLMEQSWRSLSLRLNAVQPETLKKTLSEFRIRRQQAEAELRSAKASVDLNRGSDSAGQRAQLKRVVEHCETALKLDPTFAAAQFQLCMSLSAQYRFATSSRNTTQESEANEELFRRFVLESAKYLEHPGKDHDNHVDVLTKVAFALSSRKRLSRGQATGTSHNASAGIDAESQSALLTILWRGVEGRPKSLQPPVLFLVYDAVKDGMRRAGRSREEQIASLLNFVTHVDTQFPIKHPPPRTMSTTQKQQRFSGQLIRFLTRLRGAEQMIELGDKAAAKTLLLEARTEELPDEHLVGTSNYRANHLGQIRAVVVKLKDPAALQEFDFWKTKSLAKKEPKPPLVLQVPFYRTLKLLDGPSQRIEVPSVVLSRVHVGKLGRTTRKYATYRDVRPLAVAKDRIYVLVKSLNRRSESIAYVPLDNDGNPVGRAIEAFKSGKSSYMEWDKYHMLPNEAGNRPSQGRITQAETDKEGRLILAVEGSSLHDRKAGLAIYSPDVNRWRLITPDDGLRTTSVRSFFKLDEKRLYCAGVCNENNAFFYAHFELNLETKVSRILHRTTSETDIAGLYYSKYLKPMWWVDGKLNGPWVTDFLSEKPQKRGRNLSAAGYEVVNGRRFLSIRFAGLREYDEHEKVVKQWKGYNPGQFVLFQQTLSFPRLGSSPARAAIMTKSGKYLVFVPRSGNGVIYFDPEIDTWYGPVGHFRHMYDSLEIHTLRKGMIGTDDGVWLSDYSSGRRALYVRTKDVIRAATAAGKVQTTAEYQKTLAKTIAELPLEQRATARTMVGDWGRAKQDLELWAKQEPENVNAQFLLGVIHERFGLNSPQVAMQYYGRLADSEDSSVRMTGLLMTLTHHERANRWQQVLDTSEAVLDISPHLPRPVVSQLTYRMKMAREKLEQTTENSKSPSPGSQ